MVRGGTRSLFRGARAAGLLGLVLASLAGRAPAGAAPQAAGNVFLQGAAAPSLVVMEAENAQTAVSRAGTTWTPDSATFPGFSGASVMWSLPTVGGPVLDTGFSTGSAELRFAVNFAVAGIHFVWIRGRALDSPDTGTSDSCHVGLNGAEIGTSDKLNSFAASYGWRIQTMDSGSPATLVVPAPGVHTVNVWVREDGFAFDKIILTPDNAFLPTGAGPAESAQGPPPGGGGGGGPPPSAKNNSNGDEGLNDRCAGAASAPGGLAWLLALSTLGLALLLRR